MNEEMQKILELAEQGDPAACAYMGNELYFGWNIPQDLDKAFRYLTTAAEYGHSTSQFLLAFMYGSGRGTEKNDELAFKWFLKAAEQGVPEAMYNVGCTLLHKDSEEDRALGKEWIIRSANAGYGTAYDMLSDLDDED